MKNVIKTVAKQIDVLAMVKQHNNSPSITFTAEYERQEQGSITLARGFNKDNHPDGK